MVCAKKINTKVYLLMLKGDILTASLTQYRQVSVDSFVSACSGHCDTSFPCTLSLGTGPQQIYNDERDSGSESNIKM